jgi:hypothetical protein
MHPSAKKYTFKAFYDLWFALHEGSATSPAQSFITSLLSYTHLGWYDLVHYRRRKYIGLFTLTKYSHSTWDILNFKCFSNTLTFLFILQLTRPLLVYSRQLPRYEDGIKCWRYVGWKDGTKSHHAKRFELWSTREKECCKHSRKINRDKDILMGSIFD